MMATIIKDFKAANPKATGEIKVSANFGEGEVATNLTKDVTAAADVMCIADDNIRASVKARALTALTADDKAAITKTDGATAVGVGSISDTLYGYPYRADNSYVLMYNKTLFTADQVGSLDTLLAAAKDKKTSVYFDLANGWYGASYLWANGCTQTVDTDGKFQCTFDSDAGVAAATAMLSTSGILMNIPEDLYESSRIDGASPWTQFWKITMPYVLFVTGPSLLTTFIGNINNFNVIYFLTGGGPDAQLAIQTPAGHTDLLITWLYKLTVTASNKQYYLASAIGVIVFIICAFFSLIMYARMGSTQNEEEFQ